MERDPQALTEGLSYRLRFCHEDGMPAARRPQNFAVPGEQGDTLGAKVTLHFVPCHTRQHPPFAEPAR